MKATAEPAENAYLVLGNENLQGTYLIHKIHLISFLFFFFWTHLYDH